MSIREASINASSDTIAQGLIAALRTGITHKVGIEEIYAAIDAAYPPELTKEERERLADSVTYRVVQLVSGLKNKE